MNTKIDRVSSLEVEVEFLRDEIRYLKADQRAKDREQLTFGFWVPPIVTI